MGLTDTTIKAVNEWQDKLNSATNSHKFNIHITTMSDIRRSLDHYYCDVIILYATNLPFEDVAAITHPVNVWRTFNVINVVYGNGTDNNFNYWPKEYIVKSAEHELGHTFGLNHIQSNGVESHDTCNAPEKQLSIMYWCSPIDGDWQKMGITKYDINAVIQRYTDSGFGVLNTNAGSSYTLNNIKVNDTTKQNNGEIKQTQFHGIPSWIKNTAKWWSEGSVADNDFVKGMQYLIQQGIITIPPTQSGSTTSHQIPTWIKNNAGWWANGQISDDEFVKAIQWLITNGILVV